MAAHPDGREQRSEVSRKKAPHELASSAGQYISRFMAISDLCWCLNFKVRERVQHKPIT